MPLADDYTRIVDQAFSKQSVHFDEDDVSNPILQQWRQQVYAHVDRFIKPGSRILELNAGTGIDAVRFARSGHRVHATDLSSGMITTLNKKVAQLSLHDEISVQQVSFQNLAEVNGKFDFVFSNFGGLNCLEDLTKVTAQLPRLLNKNARVTWVIMPPVCLWEWSWLLKGQFKKAFRRLRKTTPAHLEGEIFTTYYHSLSDNKKAFGKQFTLLKASGLGVISPPPSATRFVTNHPDLTRLLTNLDQTICNMFPFNRCGDHLIVTFALE
jgi:ubiquinone/menaquinone biosynthesis C-methylase UbiE